MREFDPKVSICKLRFSDIGRGGATNLALALGTSALSLWVAVSDQGASSSVYIGKIAAATFTAVFLVYTQFEKIYKNLGKRVNREFEKHQISLGNTHLIDEFRKSAIDNVITLKTAFETIDKIHQLHRLRHKNIAELNKHNITDHKKLDDKIKGLIGTLENLSQVS